EEPKSAKPAKKPKPDKKPKPAKKPKSKAKAGPARAASRRDLPDDETLSLIRSLVESICDKDELFGAEFSRTVCGIGHPLLKKQAPQGREARFYSREAV